MVEPPAQVREQALAHVLETVYPDRQEASIEGAAATDAGWLLGVKADPRGYLSTARYATVRVDQDARVVGAEPCDRRTMERRLAEA